MSRLRRQVAKARHRCYFSDGGRVVHNCKAKWHSFVYFKKHSSYPLQTWNSYSVSQRECIEARMVTQWPVFVELSALVDLDKIAIRRDIYSANSCFDKYFLSIEKKIMIFQLGIVNIGKKAYACGMKIKSYCCPDIACCKILYCKQLLYPQKTKFWGVYRSHCVRRSVRLSVWSGRSESHFCPEHNFKTVRPIDLKTS